LPPDLSSLSAAFAFAEFCKALGAPKGGETFNLFKEAVKECMESVIEVETPPDKKGKRAGSCSIGFKERNLTKIPAFVR
ncbi:MAG: hypothetical protein LBE74_04065, partial [Treponema sp.]|nr:hypothetical protein [Treponema sp.]